MNKTNMISNLLNQLHNDRLIIEMEDQQSISRSMRNYKKELMEAMAMVIKHYKEVS